MDIVNKNIDEILRKRAQDTPNGVGMVFYDNKYTWCEIDKIVDSKSNELINLGFKENEHVALLGTNSDSWVFYYLSILRIGAKALLINTRFKENEVIDAIKIGDVKHVIYSKNNDDEHYEKMMISLESKDLINGIDINMDKDFNHWKNVLKRDCEEVTNSTDPNDPAVIIFTSGTTGKSKGVMLTNKNIVNNSLAMVEAMRWNKDDKMCICVPLFHSFGLTGCISSCICSGATMVILNSTRTMNICKAISEEKCTVLNGVPSMFLALINNKKVNDFDLTSLRSGIIAGSPIYEQDYLRICEKFSDMKIQPSYGQTETSPCCTIVDYDDPISLKAVSSGKVIPNVELKIEGNSNYEEGEILVKGINVMSGYINNVESTKEVFTEDGYLRTGDLGYFDKNGYLYLTGRKKNIIIRGGENISPVEIENIIKDVVSNIEVKVIGVPSSVLQEEICAVIEGKTDVIIEENITNFFNKNISDFKKPKHILFIEKFPRFETSKIDEKALKKEVFARLEIN